MTTLRRIVLIADVYPPAPMGGATVFNFMLAERLAQQGVQVHVLCAATWEEGPAHYNGLVEDERNGVQVHRLQLNWRKAPAPFDYLYDNRTIAPVVHSLLQQCAPDLVYINSWRMLSPRVIAEARALRLPIVFYAHEFSPLCALQNLVQKDGQSCTGPDSAWKCQACVLSGTKVLTQSRRLLPQPLQQRLFAAAGRVPWLTRQPGLVGMLGNHSRRQAFMREMIEAVDLVLIPGHSAVALYEHYGFETNHFRWSVPGLDLGWVSQIRWEPSAVLRVGFTGHVQTIKGVHLLVEAVRNLPPELPLELFIYGSTDGEPAYARSLQQPADARIHWKGPFQRQDLPAILGNLDIVVVPSICRELNPNVIREAFAAGLPVIVSDQSGPREAVRNEVDGLHFRTGEVADLRRQLLRLLQEPALLDRLRRQVPPVKSIDDSVEELRQWYATTQTKQ